MSDSTPSLRILALAACALVAAAVVGTGGCKSNNSTVPNVTVSPSPSPSGSPTASPTPTATANVFVSMAYSSMAPTTDPTYGQVDGYALIAPPPTPVSSPTPTPSPAPSPTPRETPGPSSIVMVPCNVNIQFLNFDASLFHTASLLVPQGGGFPQFFNNNNGITASPLGTAITHPEFSSGFVNTDAGVPSRSLVYSTGSVPGTFFFGDFFDYNNNPNPSMRTVILVQC